MSLDDMVAASGRGKGKGGGRGGKMGRGAGRGAQARAAAAPYQKPVKAGRGKGGGGRGGMTLADMAGAAAAEEAPAKPAFVLTTGTTLRVGNLDHGVSAEDIEGMRATELLSFFILLSHRILFFCSPRRALCRARPAQVGDPRYQTRRLVKGLCARHLQA